MSVDEVGEDGNMATPYDQRDIVGEAERLVLQYREILEMAGLS